MICGLKSGFVICTHKVDNIVESFCLLLANSFFNKVRKRTSHIDTQNVLQIAVLGVFDRLALQVGDEALGDNIFANQFRVFCFELLIASTCR